MCLGNSNTSYIPASQKSVVSANGPDRALVTRSSAEMQPHQTGHRRLAVAARADDRSRLDPTRSGSTGLVSILLAMEVSLVRSVQFVRTIR